jgi:hypothetical protein
MAACSWKSFSVDLPAGNCGFYLIWARSVRISVDLCIDFRPHRLPPSDNGKTNPLFRENEDAESFGEYDEEFECEPGVSFESSEEPENHIHRKATGPIKKKSKAKILADVAKANETHASVDNDDDSKHVQYVFSRCAGFILYMFSSCVLHTIQVRQHTGP